jgi:hypothetical protein
MNHVRLRTSDLELSASSFPSHHNNPANDSLSLSPLLDGDTDIPSDSDGSIENEAEWLDDGQVEEVAKKTSSSKMSEAMALEVINRARSFSC